MLRAGPLEARADFLVRDADGRTGLRQVRAALRPSESHLDELAFTAFVSARAGRPLGSVALLHLEADFVRGAEPGPARALVRHTDVSRDVEFLARDLEQRVAAQLCEAEAERAPAIEPSPHCRRPSPCPFLPRCTRGRPADWLGFLPALRPDTDAALRGLGVARMGDVPDDFPLTPAQKNARASARAGAPFAAPQLAAELAPLDGGADFLDFEAILPELPVYPGTRPYEVVPFQWSAHLGDDAGGLRHLEFLADGARDPRREFAVSLAAAFAGRARPIAVYSGFESDVLERQAAVFPELAEPLERIRARLFDLLPLVRRTVYHPAFFGSFSLKRVVPALSPRFTWGDLPGIADGGAASRSWHALARGELSPAAAARILSELRAYCGRDSLALAELITALRRLAREAQK